MIIEQYNVDQKLALNGYIPSKIEPKNDNSFDKFIRLGSSKNNIFQCNGNLQCYLKILDA